MAITDQYFRNLTGASAQSTGFDIEQSIRFYVQGGEYISRTVSSAGNQRTFTISWWWKFGLLGSQTSNAQQLWNSYADNNNRFSIMIDNDVGSGAAGDKLCIFNNASGTTQEILETNRLFRDPSAWYHFVVTVDTTQATKNERVRLYVNGERESDYAESSMPAQNYQMNWNAANLHLFGKFGGGTSNNADGYMAECNHIDGTALGPENFGEFDDNGIWIPKEYTGSYGTNGFRITGETNNDLGKNVASGNTFATYASTNLATSDQFLDSPTNNFFTMNPISNRTYRLFEGNMNVDIGSNVTTHHLIGATMGIHPSATGKYYFEVQWASSNDSGNVDIVGFADLTGGHKFEGSTVNAGAGYGIGYKVGTGEEYVGNGWTDNSFTFAGPVASNYYGFAYDASTGRLYIYQNGTALNSGNHVATFDKRATIGPGVSIYNSNKRYNFYNGAQTSLSNDNFNYSPPTGYGPINSKRLGDDYG